MSILLNDAELDALDGARDCLIRLYIFGIRRYMDYKTGIVGIKRRISYQSLGEQLFEEGMRGAKTRKSFSRWQARRAIGALEKIGMVTPIKDPKHLILKCNLATSDESVQNKAAPKPHKLLVEAAPITAHIETSENPVNIDDLEEFTEEAAPNLYCTKNDTPPKAATPPLSGKDININKDLYLLEQPKKRKGRQRSNRILLPPEFCVTDEHRAYALELNLPSPDEEIEKFKNYWQSNGESKADWNATFKNWLINAKEFQRQRENKNANHFKSAQKPKSKTAMVWESCAPGAFGFDSLEAYNQAVRDKFGD